LAGEAKELGREELTLQRQRRRSFRRVFLPLPQEQASDADRLAVLEELDTFCCLNTPFKVDLSGSDPGVQLAVQEGRRTVLLFIRAAIRKSYEEQTTEQPTSQTATVE
jgi:hypothetical protein